MKLQEAITRAVDFFYVRPVRKVIPAETFRYAFCGGFNMLLGIFVYWLFFHYVVNDRWLDLGFVTMSPHVLTLFIQTPVTFFTGFWLQRNVTFRESPLGKKKQMFRYLLQNIGSFIINYFALKLFVEAIGIYPTISKPIADLVTVVFSYLVAKFFTFRTDRKDKD